jgi:hypothetical protein
MDMTDNPSPQSTIQGVQDAVAWPGGLAVHVLRSSPDAKAQSCLSAPGMTTHATCCNITNSDDAIYPLSPSPPKFKPVPCVDLTVP